MIVVVDFDGTLAIGHTRIMDRMPNLALIKRLQDLKSTINPTIKVVTARGSRFGLPESQKIEKYHKDIKTWLNLHNVPHDCISFNKEYGAIYIDDMTVSQDADFSSLLSPFTKNKLIFTDSTVIKKTVNAELEYSWYQAADGIVQTPKILFCNDEMIILDRVKDHRKPTAHEIIDLIESYKNKSIKNYSFDSYKRNLPRIQYATAKVQTIIDGLDEHEPSFFHGDLSTTNILVKDGEIYSIDPNYKGIFGSYLTDAGKAFFSLLAYEQSYSQAKIISDKYGQDVIKYAIAEGLRVCKYNSKYISVVNNMTDLI
jgi:hypothetical protein